MVSRPIACVIASIAVHAAHVPKPHCGGERQVLIAAAYLLRCFNDIPALGEIKRVALAEKIFGVERIAGTLQRVQAVTASWGYRAQCQPLMSLVAELLLFQQRPELESLSLELMESVRTRWQDSNYRSSLYFQLGRALAALGIIAGDPQVRNRSNRELARQVRIAGVAQEWVVTVERWEATSTLTPRSRAHGRDARHESRDRAREGAEEGPSPSDRFSRSGCGIVLADLALPRLAAGMLDDRAVEGVFRECSAHRRFSEEGAGYHPPTSTVRDRLLSAGVGWCKRVVDSGEPLLQFRRGAYSGG